MTCGARRPEYDHLMFKQEMRRRGSTCAEMEFGAVLWCSATSSSGRCGRACSWYDPTRDDGEPWITGAGGAWAEAKVGRASCPEHGVVVERVPWPGPGITLKGQAEVVFPHRRRTVSAPWTLHREVRTDEETESAATVSDTLRDRANWLRRHF